MVYLLSFFYNIYCILDIPNALAFFPLDAKVSFYWLIIRQCRTQSSFFTDLYISFLIHGKGLRRHIFGQRVICWYPWGHSHWLLITAWMTNITVNTFCIRVDNQSNHKQDILNTFSFSKYISFRSQVLFNNHESIQLVGFKTEKRVDWNF